MLCRSFRGNEKEGGRGFSIKGMGFFEVGIWVCVSVGSFFFFFFFFF